MSLRKFGIVFRSAVLLLCCFCVEPSSSHCPNVCQCYNDQIEESVWNCSSLLTPSQLWNSRRLPHLGDLRLPQDVKHLLIQDSKIDFPEDLTRHFSNLKTLELSNNLVNCTKHLTWLLKLGDKLKDAENVQCTSPQTFNGTQVLKALQLISDVDARCPERCVCELAHVPKDDQYVTVSVSCNNLGFTEIPKVLPANVTIHMDLSNNRVGILHFLF